MDIAFHIPECDLGHYGLCFRTVRHQNRCDFFRQSESDHKRLVQSQRFIFRQVTQIIDDTISAYGRYLLKQRCRLPAGEVTGACVGRGDLSLVVRKTTSTTEWFSLQLSLETTTAGLPVRCSGRKTTADRYRRYGQPYRDLCGGCFGTEAWQFLRNTVRAQ